ncbi:MAG: shikimate dehydrogenase [Alphaproteobacteria bacterium]
MTSTFHLAGVIGWPVSHSLSPRLHSAWLQELGIAGAYVPLPVEPHALPAAIAGLKALGFAGANVTVPHKEAVLKLVDALDPTARAIGAVNTLVIEGGRIEGRNTDAFGFIENLKASQPEWRAKLGARAALVLGAGGAARAVVYALAQSGVSRILIANRSAERAMALALDLGGKSATAIPWDERSEAVREASLIINTTSPGMRGQPALGIHLSAAAQGTIVYDLVYNPLETPLLHAARKQGLATVDGLGMLIHQARAGFKAWFGADPPVTSETHRRLAAALS